jgi:hypothetical protein
MGRRKQVLTPSEIEERKKRWWGDARNARRRARYKSNKDYREQAIAQVRESYRQGRLRDGLSVRQDDCRENIPLLTKIGQDRPARVDGEVLSRHLTFTIDELAVALGRNTQVVYRWVSSGLMPGPVFEARNSRDRWQHVYVEGEVRALLEVIGAHQATSQYYRARHSETRDRVMQSMRAVRLGLRRTCDSMDAEP